MFESKCITHQFSKQYVNFSVNIQVCQFYKYVYFHDIIEIYVRIIIKYERQNKIYTFDKTITIL